MRIVGSLSTFRGATNFNGTSLGLPLISQHPLNPNVFGEYVTTPESSLTGTLPVEASH